MALGGMKEKAKATEGYANMARPKVFKEMTLSRQGNMVKATHRFLDPKADAEHYLFGEGEGRGLVNHIGKHMGMVSLTDKKNAPEGPEEANASTVGEAEKG